MSTEPLDTRVINGRFVVPGGSALRVITIHEGRIVDDNERDVWRNVNASGHLVFPGLIQHGSASVDAALGSARGGVTTVIGDDMDQAEACLDIITAGLDEVTIIEPRADGRVSKHGWSALLGNKPVHFDGASEDFPVIHFLYHEGHVERGMSLQRISDVTSGFIARAAGLHPRKGSFEPGADGDLFVFDPETPDPYRSITWPGRVIFSLLRGQILLYNGQIHTTPGAGIVLP